MPNDDHTELSPEEAERIVSRAQAGELDIDDPEIRRVVSRAQRAHARHSMWGDAPRRRVWLYLGIGIAFLTLWIVGLAVPLLLTFG
ncbi:hypothetical protein [Microbacterium sp.]|uniref:hypothetical protein n=1 Tax=Microbacterium sp. TaxID=51671 RepID=UPI0037C73163